MSKFNRNAIAAKTGISPNDVDLVTAHLNVTIPCGDAGLAKVTQFVGWAKGEGMTIKNAIAASNNPSPDSGSSMGDSQQAQGIPFNVGAAPDYSQNAQGHQRQQMARSGATSMAAMAAWTQNRMAAAATQAQMDTWAEYWQMHGHHHPDLQGEAGCQVRQLIEQVVAAEASMLPQPDFFGAGGGFSVAAPSPQQLLKDLRAFQQVGVAALPGGLAHQQPKALPGGISQ